ncbi:palmitoyltransferase ZDHHC12 [Podarcis muralis]
MMAWRGARGSGGFMVRAVYVGLTCGVLLGLFLYPTDLQRQEEQGDLLQPLLFLALVLCSMSLYFVVSLMDPGYVEHDEEEKEPVSDEKEAMSSQEALNLRLRRCGYCLLKQPMRARHCQACRHCVRRYDHHCPWIYNCVGERNHPFFVAYLAVQLVVLLWALPVAWSGLDFEHPSWAWFQYNLLLLLSFLVVAIFTVVMILLLGCHLYLASHNTTTWEFMSRHRISYLRDCEVENPFDRGIFLNLWQFFCACRLIAWETLYPEVGGHTV